jgi:formamidopyrimidine-DNA glycosylase
MPELPELEIVGEVLTRHLVGQTILDVEVIPPGGPIVVRDLTHQGFEASLIGASIAGIDRRGKFIIFAFQGGPPRSDQFLAINPKLTGRLQWTASVNKRLPKTHLIFTFAGDRQLRYVDQKKMGQLYLTRSLDSIPDYASLGPEPFDLSFEQFSERLKRFHGEIKGILTRGEFTAGIGNAYADEILWAACLHPYSKRTQLTPGEVERLYQAMQTTLSLAVEKVRVEMGENIHLKPRDFLAVHMKTGQPCPRCGTRISLVGANQRITNFCRTCQPGGLIKGME